MITKEILESLIVSEKNNKKAIARKLGMSSSWVGDQYKKYGFQPNTKGFNKKYYANDNFFSTWSHDMAYCLGFIAADGHIWKKRFFITIGISENDVEILEYIKKCVSPDSLIRKGSKNMIQLCIHSEQIWIDLQKLGVTHGKTFGMEINFDIPEEYWGDYLRGFFDGDGSIWETTFRIGGKPYYYANFTCASRKFLEYIQNRLGFGKINIVRKKYFELKFNQRECLSLYNILYKNLSAFKLDRKYARFLKIDAKYQFWTAEEDLILCSSVDKEYLLKNLPGRTWEAIKVRKNKKCKQNKLSQSNVSE